MRGVCVSVWLLAVCAGFWVAVPVQGQGPHRSGYDTAMYAWELRELNQPATEPAGQPGGSAIVSADELRHPLSSKARRALEDARRQAEMGNHSAAIDGLQKTLIKYPASAPYADNLLGREYLASGEYVKAQESFAEAARLMPHESAPHSNLGLSLAILGQWDRAEQEVRKALQLDRANSKAKQILEAIKVWKFKRTVDAKAGADLTP